MLNLNKKLKVVTVNRKAIGCIKSIAQAKTCGGVNKVTTCGGEQKKSTCAGEQKKTTIKIE